MPAAKNIDEINVDLCTGALPKLAPGVARIVLFSDHPNAKIHKEPPTAVSCLQMLKRSQIFMIIT